MKWVRFLVFLALASGAEVALAQVNVSFRGIVQQGSDNTFIITGRSDTDILSTIIYIVPVRECAGRNINVTAEFRTQGIRGGSQPYHGVHFDYEKRAGGETSWPGNWEESPSDKWQFVSRDFSFPPNLERAEIRVGLQGVAGTMWVRNLQISPCK